MNLTTIARPYAKAIMSLAQDTPARAKWSQMLEVIALVAENKQANKYISDLSVDPQAKAEFICALGGDWLNEQGKNLIKVLAHSKRLIIAGALYQLYEKMRKEVEKELSLQLISAQDMQQQDIEYLRSLLSAELGGQVVLNCEVDPGLIGGGKLKVGDRVIEASIKDRLKTFYNHLAR